MNSLINCPLCRREVDQTTEHHLIPRSEAKRHKLKATELPTVDLCLQCHRQVHLLFTNRELGDRLFSVELLQQEEAIQKYIKWVGKIDGTVYHKSRKAS